MSEYVFTSCVKTFIDQGEPIPAKYPVKWDAHTCQSRWAFNFKTYKNTKTRLDSQTGFGLDESQNTEGKTLEKAVEEACPLYYVLDYLFGERQNVQPSAQANPIPQETTV
ncbi:hypothetical protein F443_08388 [Phytophthora nicotianae P1569]|uniref:Uncharacterized protein n=1 Tax=Phytophthora nicotianae P1569 TaxID=1317065 RepID=V9F9F5_PHYNI|nr:hypothetical protein F443_08388 [Phytophthora nicotianae P1569]